MAASHNWEDWPRGPIVGEEREGEECGFLVWFQREEKDTTWVVRSSLSATCELRPHHHHHHQQRLYPKRHVQIFTIIISKRRKEQKLPNIKTKQLWVLLPRRSYNKLHQGFPTDWQNHSNHHHPREGAGKGWERRDGRGGIGRQNWHGGI